MSSPPLIGISAYPRTVGIVPRPTLLHTANRYYVDSVVRAGGCPVVLPAIDPALAVTMLARLDGLVLPGGGDVDPVRYGEEAHPDTNAPDERRDDWDLACAVAALDMRLPLLAICRGTQVLNVALGGSLIQDLPSATGAEHGFTSQFADFVHTVRLEPGCRLAKVLGAEELGTNSLHHQAVGRLGAGVRVVGRAPDGTVEAIEVADRPEVLAIQWHPELLEDDPQHQGLFVELVRAAVAKRAAEPKRTCLPRRDGRGA